MSFLRFSIVRIDLTNQRRQLGVSQWCLILVSLNYETNANLYSNSTCLIFHVLLLFAPQITFLPSKKKGVFSRKLGKKAINTLYSFTHSNLMPFHGNKPAITVEYFM